MCGISEIILDFRSRHNSDEAAKKFKSQLRDILLAAVKKNNSIVSRQKKANRKKNARKSNETREENGSILNETREENGSELNDTSEQSVSILNETREENGSELNETREENVSELNKTREENVSILNETREENGIKKNEIVLPKPVEKRLVFLLAALGPCVSVTGKNDIKNYFPKQTYIVDAFDTAGKSGKIVWDIGDMVDDTPGNKIHVVLGQLHMAPPLVVDESFKVGRNNKLL